MHLDLYWSVSRNQRLPSSYSAFGVDLLVVFRTYEAIICLGGEIPDANLIHLARKKRAQAREQGDFIPLDDTQKVEDAPVSTQRLVR